MKIECDICKKTIDEEKIFHLNLAVPDEDRVDWVGQGVFDGMVCKDCAKQVLKMFKNKIWINKDYKKELS